MIVGPCEQIVVTLVGSLNKVWADILVQLFLNNPAVRYPFWDVRIMYLGLNVCFL